MTIGPSCYINSPTSGTRYNANDGFWVVPNNATTITVQVTAWSGANGTGSHVTVSSLTSYVWDATLASDKGNFTGSSVFSVASNYSLPNGSDVFAGGVQYTGAGVGSIEIVITYTGSPYLPVFTGFSPTIGPPGSTTTLTGSLFLGVTGVSFFSGVAASFSISDDFAIVATVPAGATTGPITISNPQGSVTSGANFTPSTVYGDNSGAFVTGVVVYADTGAAWVSSGVQVWADDGVAWHQIA